MHKCAHGDILRVVPIFLSQIFVIQYLNQPQNIFSHLPGRISDSMRCGCVSSTCESTLEEFHHFVIFILLNTSSVW